MARTLTPWLLSCKLSFCLRIMLPKFLPLFPLFLTRLDRFKTSKNGDPLAGGHQINTSSTFSKLIGFCFAGIIARDSVGNIVSGLTSKHRALNSLTAKALALRDAVSLAVNMRIDRVVFESDCLDLIKACRGDIDKGQINHVLKDKGGTTRMCRCSVRS